jgi:L-rhamnose isomerase / sugar isomerase
MDREGVKGVLREQKIELPSWAFGNSGTRFKVFAQPGVPRDPYKKIADAAGRQCHEARRAQN